MSKPFPQGSLAHVMLGVCVDVASKSSKKKTFLLQKVVISAHTSSKYYKFSESGTYSCIELKELALAAIGKPPQL